MLCAPVQNRNVESAKMARGDGGVDCRVASTDHHDRVADRKRPVALISRDEVQRIVDAGQLLARDFETLRCPKTDAEEDRVVLAFEIRERNLIADLDAATKCNASRADQFDFAKTIFRSELILRNAVGVQTPGSGRLSKTVTATPCARNSAAHSK